MDRLFDFHPSDPDSIPGGTTLVAIFSVKKTQKLQHPNEIDTSDFSIETEFEKILTPKKI